MRRDPDSLPALLTLGVLAVCAFGPGSGPPSEPAAGLARTGAPIIELRLARDAPAPGFVRASSDYASPDVPDPVYVAEAAIVSDADMEYIDADIVPGRGLGLWLHLTPEGEARLRRITGANIGARMAVLLGSELVITPVIASALGGGTMHLTHLPADFAGRMAARIAERWPERPSGS